MPHPTGRRPWLWVPALALAVLALLVTAGPPDQYPPTMLLCAAFGSMVLTATWRSRGRPGAWAIFPALVLAACGGPPQQGIVRGKDLYDTCVPCHGRDGSGNQLLGAPSIGGLPVWYVEAQLKTFQAGHRGYAAFDTVGIRMKSMSWSLDLEGDIGSVAAYVASLPRPVVAGGAVTGDAQAGQATFAVCANCHGPSAAGIEAMHAPPLAGQHDWYLVAQLRKFHDGWRGTRTGDVWGATMRPNAMVLDTAAMSNVVAYIRTLK